MLYPSVPEEPESLPVRPIHAAAVGDARDPGTWSGIPYHLTEAGREAGLLEEGLALDPSGRAFALRRVLWNLGRLAVGDRRGGYQYSVTFLERLWQDERARLGGHLVLNSFQLFPPSVVADTAIEKWFFIDLTLTQVFDYYLTRSTVGDRIAKEAVVREREGYRAARGIICMSRFTADALVRDYQIPVEKVHVVVPGANLDPATYAAWEHAEGEARKAEGSSHSDGPLRLVMVATDWERKGLDRLLRALRSARSRGARATLKVIGVGAHEVPKDLADLPDVTWLGRISKRNESPRFLKEVSDADVGCIFSRYEAGGSVLREYHALGLAAFATDAGGMPDFMFPEATIVVDANAKDEVLEEQIIRMVRQPELVRDLKGVAWRRHREALWSSTVANLRRILRPGTPPLQR